MSTTLNDEHWLNLITQCRSSGLTDRQWCIENGIPVSTFYYHVRALRKKACEVPEAVDAAAQKQEVVQILLRNILFDAIICIIQQIKSGRSRASLCSA